MTGSRLSSAELSAAADQCVKCGLCLPHCPTYRILQDEADSPRGRIALIQGLNEGQLQLSDSLRRHLDRCLLCQSCEHVCPAKVPFHKLMVGARQQITDISETEHVMTNRLLERMSTAPHAGNLLGWLRLAYQYSGLQWLVRCCGLLPVALGRIEGYLPRASLPISNREYHPALGREIGRVGLFQGCMGRDFDVLTIKSAIRLLTALGFGVVVPRTRHCCGALHLHHGDITAAEQLAREGLDAFSTLGVDTIVVTSSACAATLTEAAGGNKRALRVTEICRFLVDHGRAIPESHQRITFRPLDKRVTIHTPCSQAHALREQTSVTELISWIPRVDLRRIPGDGRYAPHCCGGAGRYMLEQPELSDRLRDATLHDIGSSMADIVVTTNIGCALHIGKGLRESGMATRLMHPVTLMARQLKA